MATFRITGELGQKLIRNPAQRLNYASSRAANTGGNQSFRLGSTINKIAPRLGTKLAPILGRAALPVATYFTAKEAYNKWSKPKVLDVAESKIKLDRPFKDQKR